MWWKTYESLPPKYCPLPHRKNIVITRNHLEGIETYPSIDAFVEKYHDSSEKIFLIGGAQLYNAFFQKKLVDTVELTLIDGLHEWDTFVDEFRNDFSEIARTDFTGGTFITLIRS
jgi:dihydrofolate reductase